MIIRNSKLFKEIGLDRQTQDFFPVFFSLYFQLGEWIIQSEFKDMKHEWIQKGFLDGE